MHTPTSRLARRHTRRLAGGLLAVAVGGAVFAGTGLADPDDISDARRQREEARAAQAQAAAELELLEAEDVEIGQAVADIEAAVSFQQGVVEAARLELEAAEADVDRRLQAVADAEAAVVAAEEAARVQAVEAFMGVAGEDDLWLTGADPNLTALKVEYLDVATGNSADALDVYRRTIAERELAVEDAEAARTAADEARRLLEDELAELEDRLATEREVQTELRGRIDFLDQELAAYEAEEAELTSWIEEQQRLALASSPTAGPVSTEGYVKPTGGTIGSGFGPRMHPILGYSRMHNGVDISGSTGDPIWASKAGTVIHAGYRGGYGYTVMIDHGGGVITLYAHMSQIMASQGDQVDRQEVIGAVGSTGLSTGPHLHFEVRVGGEPRDPMLFLP